MKADTCWFRQDTAELSAEWFFFLSDGARLAWFFLRAHVGESCVSQKRRGVAPSLTTAVAAHKWRISPEHVDECITAAIQAKELVVEGGEWIITERRTYVSERTAQRDERGYSNPVQPEAAEEGRDLSFFASETLDSISTDIIPPADLSPFDGQTPPNDDKECHPCHATSTSTSTDKLKLITHGGDDPAGAPPPSEPPDKPRNKKGELVDAAWRRCVEHLNLIAGKKYEVAIALRARMARSPIAELLLIEADAIKIADFKTACWISSPKMSAHLCPKTLWGEGHWSDYLAEATMWDESGRPPPGTKRPPVKGVLTGKGLADAAKEAARG